MINMSVQARRILSYITVVMILIGAVTLLVLAGCAYHKTDVEEERINKEIVASALADLGLPEDTAAEIEIVGYAGDTPWLDYYVYVYALRVDDKVYLVGVQRKNFELHSVDVEMEITEDSVRAWKGAADND